MMSFGRDAHKLRVGPRWHVFGEPTVVTKKIVLFLALLSVTACSGPGVKSEAEHPKQAAVYNAQLGSGYLKQGKLELSKIKFEKALDQDPDLAQAHAGYALLMRRLGETRKAEKHFKRALDLDPYDSDTLNNYGIFLCDQNRIEQAEKQFMAALKDPLYKTPEYAYTNAGRCSLKIPDYNRAEAYFGKALKINPRFLDGLYEMAHLHFIKKNYRLASGYMQQFDRYDTLPSAHTPATLWLAVRLARLTGDKNAEASYAISLKNRFPNSAEASYLRSTRKR
jgi:type IV pilus assembly protein PilF